MYEDDPVRVYLNEICKIPPITRDQEIACIRHVRDRDAQAENAKKDLVEVNLHLVVSIAQRNPSDHVHILDLIQKGNDALLAAVQDFADGGGDNFSVYAAPCIERAVTEAIAASRPAVG
jgi:RNA polymerase primary sigma factor